MAQFEERQFEVPGFSLGVKLWGPKEGRPVLAFHGMLDNAASFDLLAPLLPSLRLAAVDSPGTGKSSHYPEGILPYWKGDAFLMLQLIETLGWKDFDIIAHSLGSILALTVAAIIPERVKKVVLLDVLGPIMAFQEKAGDYQKKAAELFLHYHERTPTLFPDKESAILDRMQSGRISYEAARVLVERGTKEVDRGYIWTFDRRLRCGAATFPFDDKVRSMLALVKSPVCLIRADKGLRYADAVFTARAAAVSDLHIHQVPGGHHLHLDNPEPVAAIIRNFL